MEIQVQQLKRQAAKQKEQLHRGQLPRKGEGNACKNKTYPQGNYSHRIRLPEIFHPTPPL